MRIKYYKFMLKIWNSISFDMRCGGASGSVYDQICDNYVEYYINKLKVINAN